MTKPPPMSAKRTSGDMSSAETVDGAARTVTSPLGVVHCFVEGDELRRLLAKMAAAELASVMIQSALG